MDECGNYYIEDVGPRLGRGGFGEVFKCYVHNRGKTHKKHYARKYFLPSPENDDTPVREIANLRERFLVEIKTQCSLNNRDYNCIAPVVLFNTFGNKPYFIMELAECNLRDCINNGMNEHQKVRAIIQTLKGVQLIHKNNYIHRDLKPENVLRYPNEEFKISDFGLVKDLDAVRAEVNTRFKPNALGTDGYRAPEISDSGEFSEQSDIYALGKIISEIYPGKTPDKVKAIITKCTQFFKDERYHSVKELLDAYMKAVKPIAEND